MTHKKIVLVVLIFSISVLTGLYPFISNQMFDHRKDSLIETYEEQISGDEAANEQELKRAEDFNKILSSRHVVLQDPFNEEYVGLGEDEYISILNVNNDSVIGIVTIPCIDVKLPIYHGTDAEILEKGVGHLEGTSFPAGGSGTHAVLTGHTGLSSAKMFTDLTQLEEGDYFFITCLDRNVAYVVDQIRVVDPTDVSNLAIIPDGDYCTLVTCTPYGVNSHRLLVRGIRTAYEEDIKEHTVEKGASESQWMLEYKKSVILCFSAAGMILVISVIVRRVKDRKERCTCKKEG